MSTKSKRLFYQLVIVLFLSTLYACASTENGLDAAPPSASRTTSDCISQGSIRDYRVLDDANLIVSAGASRKYHVALSRRMSGFSSGWQLGFSSAGGRVCAGSGEVVTDNGFGPEKIRITSIRQLTPEDEVDLLIRFGKKEPEYEQPRQPEEIQGAEVEELDKVETGSR